MIRICCPDVYNSSVCMHGSITETVKLDGQSGGSLYEITASLLPTSEEVEFPPPLGMLIDIWFR